MKVYRFEDSRQLGPWMGGGIAEYIDAHRCRNPCHSPGDMPPPENDDGLFDHYITNGMAGMVCAFSSLRQLKRAFPSSKGRAAMYQQRLLELEIDGAHVIVGERQVLLHRDRVDAETELCKRTFRPMVTIREAA